MLGDFGACHQRIACEGRHGLEDLKQKDWLKATVEVGQNATKWTSEK